MNIGTAIALVVVGAIVFFAMRSILRDFRKGSSKCAECGGSCGKTSCSSCDAVDKMAASLKRVEQSLPPGQ